MWSLCFNVSGAHETYFKPTVECQLDTVINVKFKLCFLMPEKFLFGDVILYDSSDRII